MGDGDGQVSDLRGRQWFVANTRPHAERAVVANLARQEFLSFLPLCLKTIRHARQFRTAVAPLFPGYVFVSLDLSRDRWRSVNGTFGVVSLIMGGSLPRAVPAGVVETLQDLLGEDQVIRLDRGLKPGQLVRVLSGPFADQLGVLDRLDGHGRVRILLEMMGSIVPLVSTTDQLVPA